MNDREKFEDLIGDYAEGSLSPANAEAWNAMMAAHPDWREEAEQERTLVTMMRSVGKMRAPAGLKAEVLAELSKPESTAVVPVKRRALWQIAAAAAILVAGIFVYTHNDEVSLRKPATPSGHAVIAMNDERVAEVAPASAAIPQELKTAKAETSLLSKESDSPAPAAAPVPAAEAALRNKAEARANMPAREGSYTYRSEPQTARSAGEMPSAPSSGGEAKSAAPATKSYFAKPKQPTVAQEREDNVEVAGSLDTRKRELLDAASESSARPLQSQPDAEQSKKSDLNNSSSQLNFAQRDLQQSAFQSGEPAMTLPTREQVRSAVIAKTGKVLLDTPWYETAVDYQDEHAMVPERATAANARYIVAQVPTIEDAKQIPGATMLPAESADKSTAQDAVRQQTRNVRVVIPYAATRRDEMELAQQQVAGLMAATRSADGTSSPAEEMKDTAKSKASRQLGLQSTAASSEVFATFDEFDQWMRRNRAQFLFYTSVRRTAFSEETNVKTPVPLPSATGENPFTGFLVYYFKSAKQADEILGRLPGLQGEGLRDMGLANAELVAQPDGVRLIIPYRMALPEE